MSRVLPEEARAAQRAPADAELRAMQNGQGGRTSPDAPRTRSDAPESREGAKEGECIVVSLPLPPAGCWPNRQRVHWRVRWAAQREAKEWGLWAGAEAVHAVYGTPCEYPQWRRCEVTVRFRWPDRRRRDLDNALGACKPYFDSFTDLCIWQDDSGVSFVLPPATVDRENPGVTVTICEVRGGA
jgi:hypothetical protein